MSQRVSRKEGSENAADPPRPDGAKADEESPDVYPTIPTQPGPRNRLSLGPHHRLPLNHLSADASSRKLWTLTPCWRPINSMY